MVEKELETKSAIAFHYYFRTWLRFYSSNQRFIVPQKCGMGIRKEGGLREPARPSRVEKEIETEFAT
ncbi:hypothetical protein KM043_014434 [Ampulex compressa]|nr:hypothetical protein KM043_014434 [Ampulex compressa]